MFNKSIVLDRLGDRAQAITHAEAALLLFEQIEYPGVIAIREKLFEWRGGDISAS
jgi:hypothetical protein